MKNKQSWEPNRKLLRNVTCKDAEENDIRKEKHQEL